MKSGNLNFLEPSGPLQACNGTALPFIDMLLSAVSVLVVAQSSSEIPEGLMNNPVYTNADVRFLRMTQKWSKHAGVVVL